MEQYKIDRIHELARKAKAEPLTPEEQTERQALREEYIQAFRQSLTAQLDNTVVMEADGSTRRLSRNKNTNN